MIYVISFLYDCDKQYNNYFTFVDKKMDKEVVFKAIKENNIKFGFNYEIREIKSERGVNIIYFKDTKDKCIIYKIDTNKEQDIKKNSIYIYISKESKTLRFKKPKYIKDDSDLISFRGVEFDDNFCKCLFKLNDDYIVRYGEPFNGGFNTSINNKRIQVRFSDGAISCRDLSIMEA